jgi:hypothetical protein
MDEDVGVCGGAADGEFRLSLWLALGLGSKCQESIVHGSVQSMRNQMIVGKKTNKNGEKMIYSRCY